MSPVLVVNLLDSTRILREWKARARRDRPFCRCSRHCGRGSGVARVTRSSWSALHEASCPAFARGSNGAAVWATRDLRPSERPVVIAALGVEVSRPLLVVTSRQETADALCASLSLLLPPSAEPLVWSAADPLPYEQLPHDPALSASRSTILGQLDRP